MKKEKGITLIALIITIVVLMIIASISIGALTGDNSIIKRAGEAKTGAEINSEKEAVDVSVVQAMNKNRNRKLTQEDLQAELDGYTGKGETTVSDAGDVFLVKFERSGRYYEVTKDGDTKYIGTIKDLANKITITADKEKNLTPEFVQQVGIKVTTYLPVDSMTIRYAWSTSKTIEPSESEFVTASSVTVSDDKMKRETIAVSDKSGAGNYYLWVKAIIDDDVVGKTFGEYAIKEDTTLVVCSNEYSSTAPFLGNSKLQRNLIKSVKFQTTLDGHTLDESNCWDVSANQKGSILAWYTEEDVDGTTAYNVTIGSTVVIKANPNSSFLFNYIGYGINTETKIEGLNNLDTSNVTSMSRMFYSTNLTNLDLTKFDTSNVITMRDMFMDSANLTNLDLSKFDTSNVTDMLQMFSGCSKLTTLNLSGFNTYKVTTMSYMFFGCSNLSNLDVSGFNTSNVKEMTEMFGWCKNLTSIDVSGFDTHNVMKMDYMFCSCFKLTSLNVSKFDTSKVMDMNAMFGNCSNLTSIDVSKFNTSKVIKTCSMFNGCSNLTSIDVSGFDTSKVTDMSYMFNGCSKLTSLNVSKFDTSKVTDMNYMFSNCSKLTSIDVSGFDTSKVINMSHMFRTCFELASLNVSNFDTSNVTNISEMFWYCSKLTNIDVSKFNTSKVTNMEGMFCGSSSLTELDISNFDTSNVTKFCLDGSIFTGMFESCTKLTELNLKNFNVTKATEYKRIFDEIPTNTKIYVSTDAMKEWVLARRSDLTNIVVEP